MKIDYSEAKAVKFKNGLGQTRWVATVYDNPVQGVGTGGSWPRRFWFRWCALLVARVTLYQRVRREARERWEKVGQ